MRHAVATLGLDLAHRRSRRCCWVADHHHDEVARVGGGLDELAAALHDVDGSRSAALPFFFLERYVPSYLREWRPVEVAEVGA
jgi:hypothetical protein